MKTHPILFIVAICLLSLSCIVPVHAQSFEVLQSWNVSPYYPITTLCKGSDGNFYGTTSLTSAPSNVGRGDGAVFQVTPQGVLKVLHVFPRDYYLTPSNPLTDAWQLLDPPGDIVAGPNGLFEHEDKPNPKPTARFCRAIAP